MSCVCISVYVCAADSISLSDHVRKALDYVP